jgi:hypothetical protein
MPHTHFHGIPGWLPRGRGLSVVGHFLPAVPGEIRAEIEKSIAKTGRCKLTDFKMDGNNKTETMVCGADTIRNETTFHGGDSFDTTTTKTRSGVVTVAHFKGRRTGDCKPGE